MKSAGPRAVRTTVSLLCGCLLVLPNLAASSAARSSCSKSEAPKPAHTAGDKRTAAKTGAILRGVGVFRLGSSYQTAPELSRAQYVVVSRNAARAAARLPGTSLVYMSGTAIQQEWSTGVPFAVARDQGWLLKDPDGRYVSGLNGSIVADVGDRNYQQTFVESVASFLRQNGDDGVFIDDVVADLRIETSGALPAKYPTPEAWETAMVDFVDNVGGSLRERGYYVLVNAVKFVPYDARSDDGTLTHEFWQDIAPDVSGLLMEFWLQNPVDREPRSLGPEWFQQWPGWQALVSTAQSGGADFFGLMYGGNRDRRVMRFGRGSFMLDWDGHGGAFVFHGSDTRKTFDTAWVKQLGSPRAKKIQRADGVWTRQYARGVVVVNARNEPITLCIEGISRRIGAVDAAFVTEQSQRNR